VNEPTIEPVIDFNPRGKVEAEYYPTPNNPPWNIPVAVGLWILSVVFAVAMPLLFLAPYLISQGLDLKDREALRTFMFTDQTAVVLQLAPIILAHGFTLLVAWFVVTKFNTYSFRATLGWSMDGFKVWHAVLITISFYAIAIALTSVFGEVDNEFKLLIKNSRYAVYLIAFFATFTAPLVEEVVYRGLLYSAFQRRFGVVLAIVVTTLLFTAVHVPQYSLGSNPDYATVVAFLLLSLTLTGIRARTGSLLPCIVLHTVFNGIQSALLLAGPYLQGLDPVVEPTKGFFFR
jgi:membrane protease YdiL (CAAX protease family)